MVRRTHGASKRAVPPAQRIADGMGAMHTGPGDVTGCRAGHRHHGCGDGPEHAAGRDLAAGHTVGQKTVWLDEVGASTNLKLVANSWVQIVNVAAGESAGLRMDLAHAAAERFRRATDLGHNGDMAAAHFASFGTP